MIHLASQNAIAAASPVFPFVVAFCGLTYSLTVVTSSTRATTCPDCRDWLDYS